MIFRRTLLAGLLVFAVASCGGDDSSNVADIVEDITSDTSGGSGEASTSDGDMEYEATGNDCLDAAAALGTAMVNLSSAMTSEGFDIETYRQNMDIARKAINDEAKADFDIVAAAYDEMAEVLVQVSEAGGIDTEEGMSILTNAESSFDNPEVTAASDRLGTYYSSTCMEYYGN